MKERFQSTLTSLGAFVAAVLLATALLGFSYWANLLPSLQPLPERPGLQR
jgi:hypothetical protein